MSMRSPIDQLEEIDRLGRPGKRSIQRKLRHAERSTLRHADKFIVQRLSNLREVRRHTIGWLILIIALVGLAMWQQHTTAVSYSASIPGEGGVYSEGVFGGLDNLNPILASSPAERSGSRLLFAQLFMYDSRGDLVGELARTWKAEEGGKVYTVELRPNAAWQDGKRITADDIVFTFAMIKDADTHSPLYASWRNVVVEKMNDSAVRFTLPAPYAAFMNSLTVGILPKHVLEGIRPAELRTAAFNTQPTVVSGPFTFQDTSVISAKKMHNLLRLKVNTNYVLGQPKLDGFHLHAYKDREDMIAGLRSQEVASLSDIDSDQWRAIEKSKYIEINEPLYNGTYAFLRVDAPFLTDVRVRQALQIATNQGELITRLGGRVHPLNGPLLGGQYGFRAEVQQPTLDIAKANSLLQDAGWTLGPDGRRYKDGQPLELRLVTISSGSFPVLAETLMDQWQQIGVSFDSQLVSAEDIQQNIISPRGYDVLLYEIALGRDPDVYAYWHSSQASERGFNLSNYKSAKVDEALESARSRLDPNLRDAKYRSFVAQWLIDVPAVALYRPTLTYLQNENVVTFGEQPLVDQTDRYFNVRYWAAGKIDGKPTR